MDKKIFLTHSCKSFIPGYTGHCPSLKFCYGKSYGPQTKTLLRDFRSHEDIRTEPYDVEDYERDILQPIDTNKIKIIDSVFDYQDKSPPYIFGYTGFIPTINLRYGKSYGQAVDDSMCDFETEEKRKEVERIYRARSTPRLKSFSPDNETDAEINKCIKKKTFKAKKVSPESRPAAGYSNHISRSKYTDKSLTNTYNNLLQRKEEKTVEMDVIQTKIDRVLDEVNERSSIH